MISKPAKSNNAPAPKTATHLALRLRARRRAEIEATFAGKGWVPREQYSALPPAPPFRCIHSKRGTDSAVRKSVPRVTGFYFVVACSNARTSALLVFSLHDRGGIGLAGIVNDWPGPLFARSCGNDTIYL